MKVVLTEKAKTQISELTKMEQIRLVKKLLHVEEAGAKTLLRMKNLPFYRLRAGNYRAIGSIETDTFIVLYIGHRSKVYEDFD